LVKKIFLSLLFHLIQTISQINKAKEKLMLFNTHSRANGRLQAAAAEAHRILTDTILSKKFFDAVRKIVKFDDSNFTGDQLAEKMIHHINENPSIKLAVYRSSWFSRSTNAYVNVGKPYTIWCNSRNFNRPLANMVGTVVHEFVHCSDYLDPGDSSTDHGHFSNKASRNYYTAPSVLGRIATRIALNIDPTEPSYGNHEAINQVRLPEVILDKLDHIAIGQHGHFSTYGAYQYSALDLNALTNHLRDNNIKNLAIYCHGGLVSEGSGADAVRRVNEALSVTKPDDFHTIGFVWKTGVGETFRENITEVLVSGLSNLLLNRLISYLRKNFLGIFDSESFDTIEQMILGRIELDDPSFDDEIISKLGVNEDKFFFGGDKVTDEELMSEAVSIVLELDMQGDVDINAMWLDVGGPEYVLKEEYNALLSDYDEYGGLVNVVSDKSIVTFESVYSRKAFGRVYIVYKLLKAIYKRWRNKTWHGIHATTAEEILRNIYVADITKAFWGEMKEKASEMWDVNKAAYSLISQLNEKCPGIEINFIGHSAGADCGAGLIKLLNTGEFNQVKLNTCTLLAPATNYQIFNDTYVKYKDSYGDFTMYSMTDEAEMADDLLDYPVARQLYPSSLLYLVSGIMEDKIDMPIVGMQRFFIGRHPYNNDNYEGFNDVQKYIYEDNEVFLTPGNGYTVDDHGDFDNDVYMILPEIRSKITGQNK
jgi:hypothetical protein